jgi:glycosyltransferase involved in cell wall biosynthesis
VKIGFFARVPSRDYLDRVEFYRQDIEILRSLGHEVVPAVRFRDVPRDADLYWIWWWTWAPPLIWFAHSRGKPAIVTGVLDYPHPVPGKGFLARAAWQRKVMEWSLAHADANVFISQWESDGVPRAFDVRNPRYLPLAVDTEFYSPGPLLPPREPFVLTVMWMDRYNVWRKCAIEIVEAIPALAAKHPDARFVIAGENADGFPEVQAAVERLGVGSLVSFPGVVSREEKRRLMRTCRVYLQPTRHEGFGAAILEAMACGAPVVSNPAGAVPEVVGDSGLLLPDPEPPTLAAALDRLWSDPGERETLGRKARERAVERFSFAARAEALRRLLAEFAKPESPAGS